MEEATDSVDTLILGSCARPTRSGGRVMRGLTDRCIIVTGGASGIGRAIAVRLAAEGAALGIWDINADAAQQTAQAIQTAGGRAEAFVVDITDHAQVRANVAATQEALGPIAGLVNCAGWDRMARFIDTDPQLWRKVVDINLVRRAERAARGVARHGRTQVRPNRQHRVRRGTRRVVRRGGLFRVQGRPDRIGEDARARTHPRRHRHQHGLPRPDRDAVAGRDGNGRRDGRTSGAEARTRDADAQARATRRLPGAVAFLLSDDAAYITGQTLSVSGGLTMHG